MSTCGMNFLRKTKNSALVSLIALFWHLHDDPLDGAGSTPAAGGAVNQLSFTASPVADLPGHSLALAVLPRTSGSTHAQHGRYKPLSRST